MVRFRLAWQQCKRFVVQYDGKIGIAMAVLAFVGMAGALVAYSFETNGDHVFAPILMWVFFVSSGVGYLCNIIVEVLGKRWQRFADGA